MIRYGNVVSLGAHERTEEHGENEEKLVLEAMRGDCPAFCTLIRAHEPILRRMAWSMLSSEADCCDAVQEAIFKAWRGLPKYAGRIGSRHGWCAS